MDITEVVKSFSKKIIGSDDLKKFHYWMLSQEGPMFRVLNDCCSGSVCRGRTCDFGSFTFKTQGHRVNEFSVKFQDTPDSTYVVLNTEYN